VDVYDPQNDSWIRQSTLPAALSTDSIADTLSCVIDDKIYLLPSGNGAKLYIYDTTTNSWNTGAEATYTIYHGSSMVATTGEYAPKQIYVLGGYYKEYFGVGLINFVYRYNPATDS
jgi:N-acetylneuraminic acid mutarotase